MLSPFLVYKISERQQLLRDTISTRQDEEDSYEIATYLNKYLTPIFFIALWLEILLFYIYTNMVKLHIYIFSKIIKQISDKSFYRCILGRK